MTKIIPSVACASIFFVSSVAMADTTTSPGGAMNGMQPTTTAPSSAGTVQSAQQQAMTPGASSIGATTALTSADSSDPSAISTTPPPVTSSPRESMTVETKRTPNRAILYTGAGVFLGTYVTTAAITAGSPNTLDKSLYLPIAGPWLALTQAENYGTAKTTLIVGSGILQGVGAGMIIAGMFIPEKVAATTIQAGNMKMNILPTSYGSSGAGVGAVGTF